MRSSVLFFGLLLVALAYAYPQEQMVEVVEEPQQQQLQVVDQEVGHVRSKRGIALLAHPVLAPLALGFAAGGLLALAKKNHGWGWAPRPVYYRGWSGPSYHSHSYSHGGWGWN
jgi:hypothetical protein